MTQTNRHNFWFTANFVQSALHYILALHLTAYSFVAIFTKAPRKPRGVQKCKASTFVHFIGVALDCERRRQAGA